MKAIEVINVLRDIAPEHLAESWDKVGLHVGRQEQIVRRTLLCIDLTEAVLEEAIKKKCQLIVAYHPPIFNPIERLVADADIRNKNSWKQTLLVRLIEAGIAVYSPHTALDAVRGGINDWLCDGLGKQGDRWSIGSREPRNDLYKIVVFTQVADGDEVRRAMSDAGAGGIGNYSECSYNAQGFGTFRPGQGAKPTIGNVGELESVDELRLEMICHRVSVGDILRAAREAHPYEEPAIDVIKLAPYFEAEDEEQGGGRVVNLTSGITPQTLVRRVKTHLRLGNVKVAMPAKRDSNAGGKIEQIAVCVGAGGSLFEKVPLCDAYVTGEMQHHQVLDLQQRGATVILAGHTNTERPFLPTYRDMIDERTPKSLKVEVSGADKAPMAMA